MSIITQISKIPYAPSLFRFMWGRLAPREAKLIRVNDFKMYIICRDWAMAPTIILTHTWEPAETKIFYKYIKKGMTVVDAGAYIGYYTLLASKLVGDSGKIYAFEPSPESLDILKRNIIVNARGNIEVHGVALTDKVSKASFYTMPHNLSGNTMFDNYSTPEGSRGPKIKIDTATLDEIIGNKKVDFIKMDIEGSEPLALRGMSQTIKNNPGLKMVAEVYPSGLKRTGSNLKEYISLLQNHFRLHIIGKHELTKEVQLQDIEEATMKEGVINLFCWRDMIN